MDILFLLVPVSVLLVLLIIAIFAWALNNGQFDDVEREGLRILQDDGLTAKATEAVDADQAPVGRATQ